LYDIILLALTTNDLNSGMYRLIVTITARRCAVKSSYVDMPSSQIRRSLSRWCVNAEAGASLSLSTYFASSCTLGQRRKHSELPLLTSQRDHDLVTAVMRVLDLADPLNKGLPLTAIASELSDNDAESIQEYHNGLKSFLSQRSDFFSLQQVPPQGRYIVRVSKRPDQVSSPQPTATAKLPRQKKLPFADCWNTPPPSRDLLEEHVMYLARLTSSYEVPSSFSLLSHSSKNNVCFSLPRHLTVLSSVLAHHLLHGSADVACCATSDDDVVAKAFQSIVLPNKAFLYSVAIQKQLSTAYARDEIKDSESACAGGLPLVVRDALHHAAFLEDPSRFILLICSHPALQLKHGVAFEELYAQSPLGSFLQENRLEPQEYDAYRLARFVGAAAPTPLKEVAAVADAVLAFDIAHEAAQLELTHDPATSSEMSLSAFKVSLLSVLNVALAFPQLFELTPTSLRYVVDGRYLPSGGEVNKFSDEELEAKIEEQKQAVKKCSNKLRVQGYEEQRYYKRILSIRKYVVSACDPNVLAYWMFDALETVGEAPTTGMSVQLLPQEVQDRTNGRSKSFQARYPHLFRIFMLPPNYYLYRADWPTPATATASDVDAMNETDLVTIVLGAYLERKKYRRSKPVYACSISMHLPKLVNKRILKEGGLNKFLLRHPECFKLDLPYVEMVEAVITDI
jgi:hypothetical protein